MNLLFLKCVENFNFLKIILNDVKWIVEMVN
jgi:hypothetical protein